MRNRLNALKDSRLLPCGALLRFGGGCDSVASIVITGYGYPAVGEVSEGRLEAALGGMILSASGWRAVFAASGGEEDRSREIAPEFGVLVVQAALCFADYLRARAAGGGDPVVLLGHDTRPTGEAIAAGMAAAVLAAGCEVRLAGVTAAPEIMSLARSGGVDGFVYISASHNPIGHNGLKFGLTDGGVLAAGEAALLAADFRERVRRPDCAGSAREALAAVSRERFEAVCRAVPVVKQAALDSYFAFSEQVTGLGREELANAAPRLGVCVDFNGSARTVSIDREFFTALGLDFYAMNDRPGEIVHRIVPEGESLEPCRRFLAQLRERAESVLLGYVPDCDGDRGNLVVYDGRRERPLEAQEVFALAVVSELSHLVWTGALTYDERGAARERVAVAVNDATSLRVDEIARAFGAAVFRAEVGEANVVGLARKLRAEGWTVRILGEGAAGGNITHPSAVRDPLHTVMALVKLLRLRGSRVQSGAGGGGFFEIWCARSGRPYRADFTLGDVIASLPACVTTSAYSREALMRVQTADHGALKDRYQAVFLREWERRRAQLREKGITAWLALAYNGLVERPVTRFGEAGRGGLRIVFSGEDGRPRAVIWMRGSGTEPVFRVMADVLGSDLSFERELIAWQRAMVIEADSEGCSAARS